MKAHQKAELSQAVKMFIAKQKKLDAAKGETQDKPKPTTVGQLEREQAVNAEDDFGRVLDQLTQKITGSHRLLMKNLALDLRTEHGLLE